jgi:hypothetical protein
VTRASPVVAARPLGARGGAGGVLVGQKVARGVAVAVAVAVGVSASAAIAAAPKNASTAIAVRLQALICMRPLFSDKTLFSGTREV